jgi:hypothetical protein
MSVPQKTQYKASSCDVWRLGTATKRGIGFENIVLLSLRNVFEDTWQADVASDRPFV